MRPLKPQTRLCLQLAGEAAELIRTTVRPSRVHRLKGSTFDVLTATDLSVEKHILRRIEAAYPSHQIVAEESRTGCSDLTRPSWFVDPVDGTTNYVKGMPLVASNIAFWDAGHLVGGATADVCRKRAYWAEHGRGAWYGRTPLSVSTTRDLKRAVVSTGFPKYRAESPDNNLAEFTALVTKVRDVRRIGVAGLDLGWVASGLLDAYWEQGDGPWDWAVGALLVREAGGRVTNYQGHDWLPGDDTLIATNGHLHHELFTRITAARRTLTAGAASAPA